MGQLGFFDADNRLTALSAKGDPLEAIDRLVPWESFRSDIEAAVLTPETERKSTAGRKPIDAIVLFRMLILQSLYNLSDEQVEYQVRDRLSFSHSMREKSARAALNRTPSANGAAVPASDHLSIARRSAQADDHATKTLLFEVPIRVFLAFEARRIDAFNKS